MKAITIVAVFLGVAAPGEAGCYSGPPSCDNPQADEPAILVTGGVGTSTSAEVLFTNGSSVCELPPLPDFKYSHTQSGLTACGGDNWPGSGSNTSRSCIKFEAGSWTTLTDNLVEERDDQSSWVTPDGDILLIGGFDSETTTEIVYQNGTSIRSFDLKYKTERACSIELPEMFILTGGFYRRDYVSETRVSRYTTSGWMEYLPELNQGRMDHGCGYFYNDDMQRVFLVAGGYDDDVDELSSTETLVEGGQAWSFQQPLPSRRGFLSGISLPDTVLMIGGSYYIDDIDYDDVLMFAPETSDWKKIGSMKNARHRHAASLVNLGDVIDYCI